jgi:hypothetical protein
MILNTYLQTALVAPSLVSLAKKGLTVTLFLIGTGLNATVLKSVGLNHCCKEFCFDALP